MDGMGCLVPVGHKDKGEGLEQQALRVPVDHKDRRERLEQLGKGERLEQQVLRVPLVQGVVEWSTQGGEN